MLVRLRVKSRGTDKLIQPGQYSNKVLSFLSSIDKYPT